MTVLSSEQNIFRCYRPQKIVNKCGNVVSAPCGHCTACILRKSKRNSMLASIEEQDNRYCMFVTLTYDEKHLPRASFEVNDKTGMTYFLDNRNNVSWCSPVDSVYMKQMCEKVQNNKIPYLYKRDCQLFLKRFRKNLLKYSDEKIRYYACGEYGPVHFRPHFHILFFFNSSLTFANFRKTLFQSWQFGRVDFSPSRSKAASYVAEYVNSSVSVARIFQHAEVCSFASHSKHLAYKFYQSKKAEIYQDAFAFADGLCRNINGKASNFSPWRSLECYFFPKHQGFNFKDCSKALFANTIILHASKVLGFHSDSYDVSALADRIFSHLQVLDLDFMLYGLKHLDLYARVMLFFADGLQDFPLHPVLDGFSPTLEQCVTWLGQIKRKLYHSKHFILSVCDGSHDSAVHRHFTRLICDYYSYKDSKGLKDNLSFLEDYSQNLAELSEGVLNDVEDSLTILMPYLYDNVIDDINPNTIPMYQQFVIDTQLRFLKSVKHKKLNDLNNIFV